MAYLATNGHGNIPPRIMKEGAMPVSLSCRARSGLHDEAVQAIVSYSLPAKTCSPSREISIQRERILPESLSSRDSSD